MSRLYVLVRSDLSPSQQAVQAGHAIAEWCRNEAARWHWDGRDVTRKPWRWDEGGSLIILKVKDELELREWYERLRKPGNFAQPEEGAVAFREPYYDNSLTAFAVVGKREEFIGLDLL